ncbi:class A beta-lactamase-related serine hydrolase [Nocardia panacis]|uniref:Class A beta-lactamase-related serine hydrolase n=1 Tax=Nocardia panacis TaxID=2340916 RepID=A0A3A4K830_9NOCA|nr:serine hydrolase domain-containing protein [Nocardia panacis]RJO73702.1 class A beta-lactamase-related serine hydrolase [Nocardia panacis]
MTIRRRSLLAGMLLTPGIVAAAQSGLAGTVFTARADPSGPDWDGFDQYVDGLAGAGNFSGVVLVYDNDRPVLRKGYGSADRSKGIPNTPETLFCICSMGKMFTAVAICQLVQQGRLSFDDKVGKYLTGFPSAIADTVTIAELLTHTSGMGDVLARTPGGPTPPTTLDGLLAAVAETPLSFPPGTSFSYSNSGFIVLGGVVRAVANQPYEDYVQQRVFEPAGLEQTKVAVYKATDIPNMALGYARVGESTQDTADALQIGNPSGGAYSTADDMIRFGRAMMTDQLLDRQMISTMLTGRQKVSRPGGPPYDMYGYGFEDQAIDNIHFVGHNGGNPGYEGQLDIYRDHGWTVAVLTNQDRAVAPVIRKSESLLTGHLATASSGGR